MKTTTIGGPRGPFLIPADPERTREVCEYLSREIFNGGYDHPELPTEGARTILDIGAGWGAFAAWAADKWPQADVLCYEPHEAAYELLKLNTKAAWRIHAAVTTDPNAVLNGCEDWGAYRTHDEKSGVKVTTVHPKDLPACDILKCDAEGVEVEVLEHYSHWERLKAALIEWHTPALRKRVVEICEKERGMRCLRNEDESRGYGVGIWVKP